MMALSMPQPIKRREQMLGGGDEHTFFHQTGGVADPGHILAYRLQLKAVEISAAEHHTRSRGSRQDSQLDRSSTVKPHSTAFDWRADCLFVNQTKSDT